jgi:D-serine dehydratase
MTNLLSGEFTVEDGKLYDYLRLLYSSEDVQIEPSSCAAFAGPCGLLHYEDSKAYCESHNLTADKLAQSVQIAWATGGRLVPEENRKEYLETYIK